MTVKPDVTTWLVIELSRPVLKLQIRAFIIQSWAQVTRAVTPSNKDTRNTIYFRRMNISLTSGTWASHVKKISCAEARINHAGANVSELKDVQELPLM